jgi:heme-degrading monooxygenase HmoA
MFIAMNRFRVKRGAEGPFEKVWLVHGVAGARSFDEGQSGL